MRRQSFRALSVSLAGASVLLLHLSCTTTSPHRTATRIAGSHSPWEVKPPISTSIAELADPTRRCQVRESSVERHPMFTVATIEFDEKGRPQAPAQADEAIQEIQSAAEGAVIVVFVHGWKHDGRICDGNLCCFREVLKFLANAEQGMATLHNNRPPRKIIGIYLAWRGASTDVSGLKELTFWSRKDKAQDIGSIGDVSKVLVQIRDTYDSLNACRHSKGNRLVLIGHSFGAALLFDAVKGTLRENLKARPSNSCVSLGSEVSGFGDLVVLVNSAFEADRYQPLLDLARDTGPYCSQQTPLLLAISADNDTPTRVWFPVGRFLSAHFRAKDRITLGNFGDFQSHQLCATDKAAARGSSEASATEDCRCAANLKDPQIRPLPDREIDQLASLDLNTVHYFGPTHLAAKGEAIPSYFPFLVVHAAPNIINGHNGIFSDRFVEFLLRFVGLSDDKKIALERLRESAGVTVPTRCSPAEMKPQ
jgi:hypothetical protein